jgi:hypothetical protein
MHLRGKRVFQYSLIRAVIRIAWIADPKLLEFTADDVGSRLASYRYRMLLPRPALLQRGHAVKIVPVGLLAGLSRPL